MSVKRLAATACFALSALTLVAGLAAGSGDPELTDRSGLGVSSAIGKFLLPLLFLIVGLWLWQKPKTGADKID